MTEYKEGRYIGERALYGIHDAKIVDCIFADGESPLKECSNLEIDNTSFQWKYPLWYDKNVHITNSEVFEMGRAGVWYTDHSVWEHILYAAPKGFRRCHDLTLKNVSFNNAEETLWECDDVKMDRISAKGNYFGMNSSHVEVSHLDLEGNYAFDGGKHLHIKNSRLLTKDCFWNCDDVVIEDSYICGEYFGWNSQNITLKNCTIESLQGFCYMKHLTLINCKLLNTTLSFELVSDIDAEVTTVIDSVKNPISGHIRARGIKELIRDEKVIHPKDTKIEVLGEDGSYHEI